MAEEKINIAEEQKESQEQEVQAQEVQAVPKEEYKGTDKITDHDQSDIFEYLLKEHSSKFDDIQSIKHFISWIYSEKTDMVMSEILEEDKIFKNIKEFENK